MQDIAIGAALKSAKFVARKHPDKPDTILRRVQFCLLCHSFDVEHAEWLGADAIKLREQMQSRTLNKFELLITAYHAKMELSGSRGNVEADVDGIKAVASVKGTDDQEHEELELTFEAPIDAKLLTFIGASLTECIDCDLKASQLELSAVASAVREGLGETLRKGESMSIEFEGKTATIDGTREEDDEDGR